MEDKIPKTLREAGYEIYCDAEKLAALAIPVVDFEIKDLIWNFDLPLWGKDGESWNLTPWDVINEVSGSASQRRRVEDADLSFPILVLKKNGKWLIVDGVHRVVKVYLNRQQTISAKIVTPDLIKEYSGKIGSKNINAPRK
jgi:hypothetical protein